MDRARVVERPPFRILGPLEVEGAGALGGPKQRALLVRLLLSANRAVARDRLVDEIWGDDPPATAAHALQVYVSELRKIVGGRALIAAEGAAYRLAVDDDDVDAHRFERLVERGRRLRREGRDERAAALLRAAEALWRGPIQDASPADPEVARLEELRIAATEERIEAELALGRHDVAELEGLVREHPLRERLRGQLMLALYRSGRQADALAAYRDARRALVDELGLEPGPELRDLEAAMLRHDPRLTVEPAEVRARRRLPAPATTLVGRARELGEIAALIGAGARLVTLTGPGGSGKTRLALEAAHDLAPEYADGAAFVGLAALRDPSLVLAELASSLGVEDPRALADHLRDRSLLLVVDNLEQVDEAAPELGSLLQAAPGLCVLATSRQALRLYGEHEYPVQPLADDEALELFAARARAASYGFVVPDAARELCRRLDRLPLAIELAAARVRDVPLQAMIDALPRLEAASEGPRDVPARQRTLRAAVDWSYDLLDARERTAFVGLAVFAGGWTTDAARTVCDVDEELLDSLASRSLVVEQEGRFSMLETIREYALERLAADDEPAGRHLAYYLSLAEEAGDELSAGSDQAEWLERLELEHDNLRAALDHAAARREADVELRLATALVQFWEWRGHSHEGRLRLEAALARDPERGDRLAARALRRASVFAQMHRDLPRAAELGERALGVARDLGDPELTASALRKLGTIAKDLGEHERARSLHEEALALSRSAGDERGVSSSLMNLADLALAEGRLDDADALSRESVELARRFGDRMREVVSLLNLAHAALRSERRDDAAGRFEEAARLAAAVGYRAAAADALVGLAAVAAEPRSAARLLGTAEALLDETGAVLEPAERALYDGALAAATERLEPDDLARMRAEGRALRLDEALAEAAAVARAHREAVSGRPPAPSRAARRPG